METFSFFSRREQGHAGLLSLHLLQDVVADLLFHDLVDLAVLLDLDICLLETLQEGIPDVDKDSDKELDLGGDVGGSLLLQDGVGVASKSLLKELESLQEHVSLLLGRILDHGLPAVGQRGGGGLLVFVRVLLLEFH